MSKVHRFDKLDELNKFLEGKTIPGRNIRTIVTPAKTYHGYTTIYFVIEQPEYEKLFTNDITQKESTK